MIPIIGIAQEFKCDKANGNYFKVTAESGLNIRQEPKSNSKKIFTIPFESVVFACKECNDCQSEIIEGKEAKWKKVYFENFEGFAFGGFLEPEISLMCPSDWMIEFGTPTFKKEVEYFGIYEENPYRDQFKAKKIVGRDTMIDDPAKGKINMIKLEKGDEPNFIISRVELADGQIINGKKQNQMLFIGEAIYFQSSYLFATGNPEISENNTFPFSKIKDYKLILREPTEDGKFREQILFTNDFHAWIGGGSYEGGIRIRWIGDIDGDNKMDILLTHATHYACWDVILFLSTKADNDELVGQTAKYQACGC